MVYFSLERREFIYLHLIVEPWLAVFHSYMLLFPSLYALLYISLAALASRFRLGSQRVRALWERCVTYLHRCQAFLWFKVSEKPRWSYPLVQKKGARASLHYFLLKPNLLNTFLFPEIRIMADINNPESAAEPSTQSASSATPIAAQAQRPATTHSGKAMGNGANGNMGESCHAPAKKVLDEADLIPVQDSDGKEHQFGKVCKWPEEEGKKRKVMVIFIRHFFCGVSSVSSFSLQVCR